MQTQEFLSKIEQSAGLKDQASAMRATQATLNTLAERLYGNEPSQLAAQLPEDIAQHLRTDGAGAGKRLKAKEFIQHVSEREGSSPDESTAHVRAVFGVLKEAVSGGEMEDVEQQLPEDYRRLFSVGT